MFTGLPLSGTQWRQSDVKSGGRRSWSKNFWLFQANFQNI